MTVSQTGGLNLSWLDEEVRREKTIVEDLRNTVDKQQIVLVDQAQRILSLEDRLVRIQNQLQMLPEIRQASQNNRDEVVAMMGDLRQDVQKREVEALRTRQTEREKDVRALQEIRTDLSRIAPLEQAATVSQAEDRRLNDLILRMQAQVDGLAKDAVQSEDGRRQLQEGLSRSNVEIKQLADQTAELATTRAALLQRLLPLENEQNKARGQITELQSMRQEVDAQQQDLLEKQRRSDRERSQTLTDWGRRLDAVGHQIEAWADQMRFYADQFEKNRAVLRDVQALAHELSQQQDRLRQTQKVAEEQLRQELREYRVENDQRWAQDSERSDLQRSERLTQDDAVESRLTTLEQNTSDLDGAAKSADARLAALLEAQLAQQAHTSEAARQALQAVQKDISALMEGLAEILGAEG